MKKIWWSIKHDDTHTQLCPAFQILGQERIQAEGDVRDATARQSHLRKRLQELSEAKAAKPPNG